LGNSRLVFFTGLLRKARGVTDKEISMTKDVEIGERDREKGKRIEAWSGIPFKLIYRLEDTTGIAGGDIPQKGVKTLKEMGVDEVCLVGTMMQTIVGDLEQNALKGASMPPVALGV